MGEYLLVERIVLVDGTVLENKRVVTNSGNFVIVSDNSENPTFTWYNVNEIRYMDGVTKHHSDSGEIGTKQYSWY